MRLNTLKPARGARHRRKRLGCGESSGKGKTSGKGHKGQKARSGGSIRLGFEGGQMPLIRRLPKRGFNNAYHKTQVAIINLDDLNDFEDGTTITEKELRSSGLIRGNFHQIKLLGRGELTKKLNLEIDTISAGAKSQLEKVGGTFKKRVKQQPKESATDSK